MNKIKWGIISTGTIAANFANTVAEMNKKSDRIELCAVASRNLETAKTFADKYGIPTAYGSYEELAEDEDIDIVYIGTPHNLHYKNMMMCMEHGKHILCEKPFTVNAKEAEEIYAVAKEKKLFVMEAFWTKYIPIYREVERIIASGEIGEVRIVTAQYGYCVKSDRYIRKFDPALAGGSLLDIGVYCIGFASMILGYSPKDIQSSVYINELGTDEFSGVVLKYENGAIAQLTTAIQTDIPVLGCIYGSLGHIRIKDFKNPQSIEVILNGGKTYSIQRPFDVNGFEYEIRAAEECVNNDRGFSEILTPDQSVAVMEIMDRIRVQWGMRYPFE